MKMNNDVTSNPILDKADELERMAQSHLEESKKKRTIKGPLIIYDWFYGIKELKYPLDLMFYAEVYRNTMGKNNKHMATLETIAREYNMTLRGGAFELVKRLCKAKVIKRTKQSIYEAVEPKNVEPPAWAFTFEIPEYNREKGKPRHWLVLSIIEQFTNKGSLRAWTGSQATMCKLTKLSRPTVQNTLNDLVEWGLITKETTGEQKNLRVYRRV